MAKRLDDHLKDNALKDIYQTVYQPYHSTETALIKVQSDIAESLDQGPTAVLIMLDLSAAFDTIDHEILFSRFEQSFGTTSKVVDWVKSYLTDRVQTVVMGWWGGIWRSTGVRPETRDVLHVHKTCGRHCQKNLVSSTMVMQIMHNDLIS